MFYELFFVVRCVYKYFSGISRKSMIIKVPKPMGYSFFFGGIGVVMLSEVLR